MTAVEFDESPTKRISLRWSPLANGPTNLAFREFGEGPCVVILHGGWGYGAYPFDPHIRALASAFRVVVPDRSGYGASTAIEHLGIDFHQRAMLETVALLDALGESHAVWWGHSDGAVIAAMAGIEQPERCRALILEALHFSTAKPSSRSFFERMANDPDGFGHTLSTRLAEEHGAERWRHVLQLDGQAWLNLANANAPGADLYQGRLRSISLPTLLIHGAADPRSEPGEFDAIRSALPNATVTMLDTGGHSPHSESGTSAQVTRSVVQFLRTIPAEST